METISWTDFEHMHMCAGTVLSVRDLPNARVPAYVLTIDFGPLGLRKSSARITARYGKQELIGQQVIAVFNLPPKQIGGIMSECLVTGFLDPEGGIVLAAPERTVPNGSRLC